MIDSILRALAPSWRRSRTLDDYAIAACVTLLLPMADAALRTVPFGRVRAWLPRPADDDGGSGAPVEAQRLAAVVDAVAAQWPWPGHCLRSALVLYTLATWRGIPVRLVIGVARDGDRQLAAHAWVECRGQPVIGTAPAVAAVPLWIMTNIGSGPPLQ